MKKKWYIAPILLFSLLGTAPTFASVLDWQGKLIISGFHLNPLKHNSDANPSTMTLRYEIADGSSHTIDAGSPSDIVTGHIIIKDLLGPGNDYFLNPGLVSHIAHHATMILPIGHVDFPTGVSPDINDSGSPLFTTNVQEPAVNINSNLDITREYFSGNIFEEDITETALDINSLATSFGLFDLLYGNNDGIISRDFELHIETSAVPLPAAAWLYITGIIGFAAMKKKKST